MNTVFCIQQKAHRNQAFPKKRKSICRCISLWSDKRKDDVFLHSKDKFFVVFAQKGQKLGVFHFLEYSPMKKYFRMPKTIFYTFVRTWRAWETKGQHVCFANASHKRLSASLAVWGVSNGIRSRNSLPTRKTARFKAFLCRWNVLFIPTVTSSKS